VGGVELRKDHAAFPTVAYGQGIGGPSDGAHPRLGIPLKALSFTPTIQGGDPEEVFPFLVLFNQLEEDYVGVALLRPDGSSVAGVLNGKTHVVPAETIRKQQYFIQALVGAMTFLYQGNKERPYISILAFDNQLTWAAFL